MKQWLKIWVILAGVAFFGISWSQSSRPPGTSASAPLPIPASPTAPAAIASSPSSFSNDMVGFTKTTSAPMLPASAPIRSQSNSAALPNTSASSVTLSPDVLRGASAGAIAASAPKQIMSQ